MTASAGRRRRTTLFGFIGIVVLMVAAGVVFVVGVVTLSNSEEGEAVGIDTRPVAALPATPNALLAVEDGSGNLVSLTVMTLLPAGIGGSIVSVPVNADATAAFGAQRRPVNELFAVDELDAFTQSVQEMLSITIERSQVVTVDEVADLFDVAGGDAPAFPDLDELSGDGAPTRPDSTDPDSTDPESTDPESTDPESTDPDAEGSVPDDAADEATATVDRAVGQFWNDVADAAPTAELTAPVDAAGQLVAPASVEALVGQLMSGEVQARALASRAPTSVENPTGADVVIVDRRDANLVFAQVSPALVSTPNIGRTLRIVAPFTDAQIEASGGLYESTTELMLDVIGNMLFFQANVVSADTQPTTAGAEAVTLIEVAEARFIPDMEEIAPVVFGESRVVLAETVIDGIDVVVTLGTDYLDTQGRAGEDQPVDTSSTSAVPGDTVAADD